MSTQLLDLTANTVPQNQCYPPTYQDLIAGLQTYLKAVLPDAIAGSNINFGNQVPNPDQRTKPWLDTSGSISRWKYWGGAAWIEVGDLVNTGDTTPNADRQDRPWYDTLGASWKRWDGANWIPFGSNVLINAFIAGGRLTASSADPLSSIDVSGATTLYYLPYKSQGIGLFDSGNWNYRDIGISGVVLSISSLTANTVYDVFAFWNTNVVTLEAVSWANDISRLTPLSKQDGVWVKSGSTNKRYIGTIRTSGANQVNDVLGSFGAGGVTGIRQIWNVDNQILKVCELGDTTASWTYNSTTWRFLNNSLTNRAEIVLGLPTAVRAIAKSVIDGTTSGGVIGIGIDSASPVGSSGACDNSNIDSVVAAFSEIVPSGYHFIAELEKSGTPATACTFKGQVFGENVTSLQVQYMG